MAALTTIATVGALAIAGGSSVAKAITGSKQQKEAQKAMEDFEYEEKTNAYANLAPSTAGAELKAENIAKQGANLTEQASSMGSRGMAFSSQIADQETQQMREVAASLDQQQAEYDRMFAAGEMQRQQMVAAQEQQELAGIGQLYNVGQQNMWSGIEGVAQTGVAATGMFGEGKSTADMNQTADNYRFAPNTLDSKGNIDLTSGITVAPKQFLQ